MVGAGGHVGHFPTLGSDIGAYGGYRPSDPDAPDSFPSDVAAYFDFARTGEWLDYFARNAEQPIDVTLLFDDSSTRSSRLYRAGGGYRFRLTIPEAEMRRRTATSTCRDVYRDIIGEVWQTLADRFGWDEPLPTLPPYVEPWGS